MASDRDDRWGDEDDRDRPRRSGWGSEAARRKVSAPAVLLIVFGLIGVLVEAASLATAVTKPTALADWYKDFIEKQPPSPQRDDALKKLKENPGAMRMDGPGNYAGIAFGTLLNVLMVVGGLKMKGVSGYGLSMTGAIAALIPCSGCVCVAMPVGLWALVVLMNPDVKAAFRGSDRLDDRRGYDEERM